MGRPSLPQNIGLSRADKKRRYRATLQAQPFAPPLQKYCCGCQHTKPSADFTKRLSNPDGLELRCRACMKCSRRVYYARTHSPQRCGRKTLLKNIGLSRQERRRRDRDHRREQPLNHPVEKWCGGCLVSKPSDRFARDNSNPDGLNLRCRDCLSRKRRPTQTVEHRKYRYGLTAEAYETLLEKQHGCCALCDRELSTIKRIVVDHDHVTKKVRGLLCDRCNLWLRAIEKPGFVRSALEYLAKPWDGAPMGHNHYHRKDAAPALIAKQGGKCGLCPRPAERTAKGYAAVDHNHQTNVIRAVLCWECNLYLTAVENSAWHAKAERYLGAA